MKKIFKLLWEKLNEPPVERLLIVLLPFLSILLAAFIIAPGVLSIMSGSPPPALSPAAEASPSPAPVLPAEPPLSSQEAAPFAEPESPEESSDGSGWQNIAGSTYYYNDDGQCVTGLRLIDGQLHFFDQYGVKAETIGIDVSFYNEFIDWPAVAAQGIDFAILRAGGRGWETGLIYEDEWFLRNLTEARLAGIELGVYFYSTATNPAEAEAEAMYVLRCLSGARLELPIFIDMEYSGEYPRGRSDRLSNIERELIINAFCRRVMDEGYQAGVYSGQNYYKNNLDISSLSKYTLWLASYTRNARLPDFPGSYDIWQFTDSGRVNGISGIVDMNAGY